VFFGISIFGNSPMAGVNGGTGSENGLTHCVSSGLNFISGRSEDRGIPLKEISDLLTQQKQA